MGLLGGVEDFYENKHLNSDLLCVNFTELSDDEFYDGLEWANKTLLENYHKESHRRVMNQIENVYRNRDSTFRGFRHATSPTMGHVSMMS
jgi:hypothetical protein